MTDLLDDVDEILSSREVLPTPAAPARESALKTCPECGTSKNKLGVPFLTQAQVNTHRASTHGYRNPEATPKKKVAKKETAPKAPAAERTRSAPVRRRPLGESLARVILQLGRVINAVEPPTGAAIMFEAGALGEAIDKAIAGSPLDKPLQKAAGVSERFEPLVPLVTMPAMVFMISKTPALQGMLEGELREALEDVLVQSLPLLKKRAQRTKATVDALAELSMLDPEMAKSTDPIGDLLESFFGAMGQAPETE